MLKIKVTLIIMMGVFSFKSAALQESKSIADIEKALNPLEVMANHDGIKRSIDLHIQFAVNSATIEESAQPQIDALGKALQKPPLNQCDIMIIGHTDATGNSAANMVLSDARAGSVKDALQQGYDVDSDKLFAVGKGESMLLPKLAANDKRHRRVEIQLKDPEACKSILKDNSSAEEKGQERKKIQW